MVEKELRAPAEGVDFIGARSCRKEPEAESHICPYTLKPYNVATDSSRIYCIGRMRGV